MAGWTSAAGEAAVRSGGHTWLSRSMLASSPPSTRASSCSQYGQRATMWNAHSGVLYVS